MKAFDDLDDETEKSDVCHALAMAADSIIDANRDMAIRISEAIESSAKADAAMDDVRAGHSIMAQKEFTEAMSNAIASALAAVDSKQIVITESSRVTEWRFKVVRDAKGDMDEVIATALVVG